MKPAPFHYHRASSLDEAVRAVAEGGGTTRVLAGGQSLVPMLNLRLTPLERVIDISRLSELRESAATEDHVTLGACVTHAEIEDSTVPDPSRGLMPRVAHHLAYRAVRNRGTVGGSLALADPSAEWPVVMTALGATIEVRSAGGKREIAADAFFHGAYTTALAEDDVLCRIRVPRLSDAARIGYYKVCRKTGEYAMSVVVIVRDRRRDVCRVVLGAAVGRPVILAETGRVLRALPDPDDGAMGAAVESDLTVFGDRLDTVDRRIHATAVLRAAREALAA